MSPDSSAELAPVGRLGPYDVVRTLGAGGMGIVYGARDEALDRAVALKVISPRLAHEPDFRERFTHEARAQASLDSAHVVGVYAFGETDGRLYIATALMPEGDLGGLLRREGRLAPAHAVDLVVQVAHGLATAHAAGLVHRDIKPGNVLLRRRGTDGSLVAALGDFGVARRLEGDSVEPTTAGAPAGTPTYMAPELHLGGRAGPATDVYAVGCLLWTALTGTPPYVGESDYLVVQGHVSGPVPQLGDPALAGLDRVLRTALAKDPAARHPSAGALRDDLRAAARELRAAGPVVGSGLDPAQAPTLVQAGPPPGAPTAGSATRAGRRRLALAAGAVAVVLVVAAVVGVLLAHGSGRSGSTSREARAETAIAAGYERNFGSLGLTQEGSRCIARTMVGDVGVDRIVESGIVDDDLRFHTVTLAGYPDVDTSFQGAVTACNATGVPG